MLDKIDGGIGTYIGLTPDVSDPQAEATGPLACGKRHFEARAVGSSETYALPHSPDFELSGCGGLKQPGVALVGIRK